MPIKAWWENRCHPFPLLEFWNVFEDRRGSGFYSIQGLHFSADCQMFERHEVSIALLLLFEFKRQGAMMESYWKPSGRKTLHWIFRVFRCFLGFFEFKGRLTPLKSQHLWLYRFRKVKHPKDSCTASRFSKAKEYKFVKYDEKAEIKGKMETLADSPPKRIRKICEPPPLYLK